ncbi:30S ribosomal protein 3, chloroplastic-like [Mangifera indica]|uniref:30S ribosomal protein 3, chloroplastic-like n=1 Tax=Mangifera indica TaxID=29780 RepID=UPI001CFC2CEF|nr:30S ribosomal protein 3, chloroplastic-like [Mangifera indica]
MGPTRFLFPSLHYRILAAQRWRLSHRHCRTLSNHRKMLSMSFQPPTTTTRKNLLSKNLLFEPFIKTSVYLKPHSQSPSTKRFKLNLSSSLPIVDPILNQQPHVDDSDFNFPSQKQKLGVFVKPNKKPRLVLKFIWMQNNIGVALDQMIPGHGTVPLSPYYFWPRKDAWEELKVMLESKPWISQMERINLLNQATDIINLWQNGSGNL